MNNVVRQAMNYKRGTAVISLQFITVIRLTPFQSMEGLKKVTQKLVAAMWYLSGHSRLVKKRKSRSFDLSLSYYGVINVSFFEQCDILE